MNSVVPYGANIGIFQPHDMVGGSKQSVLDAIFPSSARLAPRLQTSIFPQSVYKIWQLSVNASGKLYEATVPSPIVRVHRHKIWSTVAHPQPITKQLHHHGTLKQQRNSYSAYLWVLYINIHELLSSYVRRTTRHKAMFTATVQMVV